jgi:colanic acid biosynthesis glycosyl transferase WcaI
MPYYPEWQIYPEYRGALSHRERRGGAEIFRAWHLVSPQPATLGRLLHEFTLCLFAIPSLIRVLRGARIAFINSPDMAFAATGAIMARLFRVPTTLLVHDVMPDAAVELGMLKNPAVLGATRWLARRLYAMADEIVTLGDGMRRRIQLLAGDRPIGIVPVAVNSAELAPPPASSNEFRARFVPPGTFAVLHSGNMGQKQDLHLLLRTAARLRGEADLRFFVFGDGAVKVEFLAQLARLGLNNVAHFPLQDRALLPHMLAGADAVLVSQRPEVVDIVLPSKLLTAMAAGAMIVAACAPESETARVVRESGGGLLVPASDDATLADTLLRIKQGDVDAVGCRERARAYALQHFDREAVYGPIADRLGGAAAGTTG